MSSSLHSYDSRYTLDGAKNYPAPVTSEQTMNKWEMRITGSQLLVLWCTLAGMMVAVFVFGFHAGRQWGVNFALEEASEQAVRLPIAQPVADASGIQIQASSALSQEPSPAQVVAPPSAGTEFKFSESEKLPSQVDVPSAGIADQPANSLFKQGPSIPSDAPSIQEKLAKEQAKLDEAAAKLEAEKLAQVVREEKLAAEKAAAAEKEAKEQAAKAKAAAKEKEKLAKEKEALAKKQAATKAQSSKTVAKAAPSAALAKGWYVQAAAAGNERDANGYIQRLRNIGLGTTLERANIQGRLYFRVLVGPYADKSKAEIAKNRVAGSGLVQGTPFVKYVR